MRVSPLGAVAPVDPKKTMDLLRHVERSLFGAQDPRVSIATFPQRVEFLSVSYERKMATVRYTGVR